MTLYHHPTEDRLVDYATGALAWGARLVVGAHLGACSVCSKAVGEADAVGGALLSVMPPVALKEDALALALARIERPSPVVPTVQPAPPGWIEVPGEISRAAQYHRRWAAPGVWVAPVASGPGAARGYLLGIAAGMSVPRHTHRGMELVCVLKGAYRDGAALYSPGDFACSDDNVDHRPRITDDGECVCLVFTQAPLVPRDWVGRLFQPLVGI